MIIFLGVNSTAKDIRKDILLENGWPFFDLSYLPQCGQTSVELESQVTQVTAWQSKGFYSLTTKYD